MKNGKRRPVSNYGPTAERRVDQALESLKSQNKIHFWFRAPRFLDAEGIDHLFGIEAPEFAVWIIQVTSGKNKRKTYYKKLTANESRWVKKPYRRRRYYRYIPLLAVTKKSSDSQIQQKIRSILKGYKPISENEKTPNYLQQLVFSFLAERGLRPPEPPQDFVLTPF